MCEAVRSPCSDPWSRSSEVYLDRARRGGEDKFLFGLLHGPWGSQEASEKCHAEYMADFEK